jgi:hypothetical protein
MFKRGQGAWLENTQRCDRIMPKSRQRIFAALCLAAAVVAAVFLRIQLAPGSAETSSLACIGHPLPALTVESSEGTVDVGKLTAGARSVIVFYSPACETCERALPALRPFPDTLRLILVNESPDEAGKELSGFPGAAYFSDRQKILSKLFAVPALPTILLIDESGILRDGIVGSYRRAFIQQKLENFAIRSYSRTRKSR